MQRITTLHQDYLWITLGLPLDYPIPNGLFVILERVDIGYIGSVLGYGCTI